MLHCREWSIILSDGTVGDVTELKARRPRRLYGCGFFTRGDTAMEDGNKAKGQATSDVSRMQREVVELRAMNDKRARVEEQLQVQLATMSGINTFLRDASGCGSETEVAAIGLKVAEQLTGSKFGFIVEINETGLFDNIAISDPGWDACRIPHSEVTKLIKDMEIRGIDRSALKDGRSRIVNDPFSHPDSVGVPRGHPPITCFLGVPMKQGRKTVGMVRPGQ